MYDGGGGGGRRVTGAVAAASCMVLMIPLPSLLTTMSARVACAVLHGPYPKKDDFHFSTFSLIIS